MSRGNRPHEDRACLHRLVESAEIEEAIKNIPTQDPLDEATSMAGVSTSYADSDGNGEAERTDVSMFSFLGRLYLI